MQSLPQGALLHPSAGGQPVDGDVLVGHCAAAALSECCVQVQYVEGQPRWGSWWMAVCEWAWMDSEADLAVQVSALQCCWPLTALDLGVGRD